MANDSVVTQNTLQTFYNNKVYPYLNGATHTGCVPLGTVLPYYGETAPEHFLICDGTEYLKSDYGELATHLLSLTDPTPYQGSDTDHFKVPDLRGEFLRGSGTNSHTDQGSGGAVGEHQDGTGIPDYYVWNNSIAMGITTTGSGLRNEIVNPDVRINSTGVGKHEEFTSGTLVNDNARMRATIRPTNTSVTYIIAYQNAYIDLALDGFPIDITQPQDGQLLMYDATAGRWVNGGHKYSTDEHIVGTWIDGKPIYEKIINTTIPTASSVIINVPHNIILIEQVINIYGIIIGESNTAGRPIPYSDSANNIQISQINSTSININKSGADFNNRQIVITIQYTKTTDTV